MNPNLMFETLGFLADYCPHVLEILWILDEKPMGLSANDEQVLEGQR